MIPLIFSSPENDMTADNEKLALISYHQPWNTPIPISSDIDNYANKKHLIWEYPGITWSGEVSGAAFMAALYYYTALLAEGGK